MQNRLLGIVTSTRNAHKDESFLIPKVEKLHGATPNSLYALKMRPRSTFVASAAPSLFELG